MKAAMYQTILNFTVMMSIFFSALDSMHVGEASHLVLTSRSTVRPAWITSACKFHYFFSVYFPIHAFLIFKKRLHTVYDPNLN